MKTCERELTKSINRYLGGWIKAEIDKNARHEAHREIVCDYLDWADFYGVRPTGGGHIVAGYLLELAANGVPHHEIKKTAAVISRAFLDLAPVAAALALARAQTDPNRVLN
jgi:hypothetical protein